MLEVRNLSLRYRDREILKEITFTADSGKITTIFGPNGAGKSTLLKCIIGIWRGYSGEILLNGKRVDSLSFEKRAKLFSVVFQDHEPLFPYTVSEIVLMGRISYIGLFSHPKDSDYRKVEEVLRLIGIYDLKEHPYTRISGGERQLTLIARALTQETPVILLDEPTNNLDFKNQYLVLSKIRKIVKEKGLISVIILHDPNLTSIFSDKVIVLKNGKVLHNGDPKEVMTKEVLKEVYGIEVEVISKDGINLIYPNGGLS